MAYLEVGRGPPLVCVHGTLGDFRTWSAVFGPLSKERRVISSYCVIIFCRLYVAALAPQQGHRGRVLMSALIKRTRMVAIEFGMWRSGRKGGSPGSITAG